MRTGMSASSTSPTWARSRPRGPRREDLLQRVLSNDVAKIEVGGRPVLVPLPRGRRHPRRPLHLPARAPTATSPSPTPRTTTRTSPGSAEHAGEFDAEVRDVADELRDARRPGAERARARSGARSSASCRRACTRPSCTLRRRCRRRGARLRHRLHGRGRGRGAARRPTRRPALWARCSTPAPTPAGLGARDTLRLEVCFHLYGNDMDDRAQPDRGRARLVLQGGRRGSSAPRRSPRPARRGPSEKLVPFAAHRAPGSRARETRSWPATSVVGEVTSGTLSPSLEKWASAWPTSAPTSPSPAPSIEIDVRGKRRAGPRRVQAPLLQGRKED